VVDKPRQFTLAIEHPHESRLDNFVVGANAELLQALKAKHEGFNGYWVFGPRSCGRTHLLAGCYIQAQAELQSTVFIPAKLHAQEPTQIHDALAQAGQSGQMVIIDDVDCLLGNAATEAMLLLVYQRLLQDRGTLLISHIEAAKALSFVTLDLASRMRSLQHFQIQPLSDRDKMQLLAKRAQERGYELGQAVLDYWLARGPRDIANLLKDLDHLDAASLEHQQRVTIPLLKQVLGY